MTDVYRDRVLETTTTTGTGTLTLAGAVAQYQAFSTIGVGNTCRYTLLDANGVAWEVGDGTVGSGTLSRDTVLDGSSGPGVHINLSNSGVHQVFNTPDATLFPTTAAAGGADQNVQYNKSGSIFGDNNLNWDYTTNTFQINGPIPTQGGLAVNGDIGCVTLSTNGTTILNDLRVFTFTTDGVLVTTGGLGQVSVNTNIGIDRVGGFFHGGGQAVPVNSTTICTSVPFAGTITAWTITVDTGTCTIKTWKKATGTAIPTSGDSISTSGVSISSGTVLRSTTLTDFTTTAVAANDLFIFSLAAVSGAKQISFMLEITKS